MSTTFAHAALAISAALFDSLWEGALIVGAVWLGLRCLPKLDAATRYAIWLCALAALVLTPALTVGLSEQSSETVIDAAVISEQGSPIAPVAQPRINAARVSEPAGVVSKPTSAAPRKSRITIPQSLAVAVALIWMLAACARGVMLLLNVRDLAAIRRDATLWSSAHEYPVFLSNRVGVPLAVGFLHPAIILPASLVEQLSVDAVETIVIHEIAHLRRYDVWTNALARIAETLVALNPAAWFVLGRLSMEREIACDDWVVARTGAGDAFAQTLATMARSAGGRVPIAAPSAIGSRHSIVVRIERLLDSRPRRLRLSPSALGGSLMLLALIALVMQSVSPVLAYEPQPDILAQGSAGAAIATSCAVPDRAVRMTPKVSPASPPLEWEMDARRFVARFGASNVATFDLTVDAAGKPRKVVVLSAPRYPGMVKHVTRVLMTSTYEPELRNCVPVAATIRGGGLPFLVHKPFTRSVIAPVYPSGWSARYKSACKVPAVDRGGGSILSTKAYPEMLPAFANSMPNISIEAKYSATVRVHLNATTGVVTRVAVHPSGLPAFDIAVLTTARRATYPLTASNCKPLPTDYEWRTTFSRGTFPP